MKTLKCSLFFLLLSGAVSAQEKNTMVYEVSYGSNPTITVKANDAYATVTNGNLSKMEKEGRADKIYDFSKNVCVFLFDLGKNPWFILEDLDTIYGLQDELKKTGMQQTINGFKCDAYKLTAHMAYNSGLYGLSTTNADYDFTVWVSRDVKVNPKISRYMISLLTGNLYNANISGMIVKIDMHTTVAKKNYDGEVVLKSSSSEALKTSQVHLPWTDERFTPAITIERNIQSIDGHDANFSAPHSSYTQESAKDYVKRMDELFNAVTGNVYKKYKHVPLNPYM